MIKCIAIRLPYLLATCMLAALCSVAVAQAKFTTVVADRQPALSDYVQVEYTIENAKSVEKVNPPAFKGFRVVQGPIQSDGMSYMNGVMSQYKSVTFILQPLITGSLIVPGATAVVDGKTVQSEPVIIAVKKQAAPKSVSPLPGITSLFPREEPRVDEEYLLKPGESATEKIKNNLLVKTVVNKTTCYEGEPIMATFLLCSRLKSESRVLKRPSLNGFSVFDMADPEASGPTVQPINGRPFNVHLIRKTQLFPLQPGTFVIDPVELDNTVRFIRTSPKQAAPKSHMEQLMEELMNEGGPRGELEEHSFTLASKPVSVTVKPLPDANKPEGFNGAVGKFAIEANLKNNTVAAGDAAVLEVQIKGQGNFTVINPPALSLPSGMEGYEPAVKENINKLAYPLSGTKTFSYTFITKDTGTYKIPGVTFSYFDPSEVRYKTVSADSVLIHVVKAKKKRRFFFLHKPNGNTPADAHWIDAIPVDVLVPSGAGILLAALGIFVWRRNARTGRRKAAAAKAAAVVTKAPVTFYTDPLYDARVALNDGRSQQFYSEVNKAVWKRLSELLLIPAAELNKYNVVAKLQHKNIGASVVQQLQHVLGECEIALYTPEHTATDMQHTLSNAEEVMKALAPPV